MLRSTCCLLRCLDLLGSVMRQMQALFGNNKKVLCINPTLFISLICIPCLETEMLQQERNDLFHNEFIARIERNELTFLCELVYS